ncbi:MAG: transporter substrate-binding domain-containing protein [Oscillospiraceae bacterium]|nr:transporter substrate-binding domain-containing protein [Oscillospiraceae bacterium]
MKKTLAFVLMTCLLLCCFTACADKEPASDLEYVKENGKLVVGITDFAPMDFKDESGEWIGFDADLAIAFGEYLDVEVEFIEIVWGNKEMELNDKGIDCIWNGMTLTDGVKAAMDTSVPYCGNSQVVVVNKDIAAQYQTIESLNELNFVVEDGSAGAEQLDALGIDYIVAESQADALMEVAAGTSDACVIDLLMAGATIGEGTSYPDLTYTISLNQEEYVVGFRTGSDLTEKFNTFFAEACASGLVESVAKTYGVQEAVILQ